MTALLEIEVDSPLNRDLYFPPTGRRVRGRIDVARAVKFDGDATSLLQKWPTPIPGQRIGFDADTEEGYLAEPLYETEHTVTRELIESCKFKLEPKRTDFKAAHKPTWLFWLKSAVESGHARVTAGELPETIEGEPQTAFIIQKTKDSNTRLAEALERQTAALERQSDAMTKLLVELTGKKR